MNPNWTVLGNFFSFMTVVHVIYLLSICNDKIVEMCTNLFYNYLKSFRLSQFSIRQGIY